MAGFNTQKAGKIGSGLVGLAGTLANAYNNVPQAQKADRIPLALMNMGYKPSDMEGIMAQYNHHQVGAQPISAKDLYDPSMGDQFRSMFGAGMSAYGATQSLTDNLKGTMGTTFIQGGNGFNTGTNKGWGEWGNRMEGFLNDENFMSEFKDKDGNLDQNAFDTFAGSYIFGPGRESKVSLPDNDEFSNTPRLMFDNKGGYAGITNMQSNSDLIHGANNRADQFAVPAARSNSPLEQNIYTGLQEAATPTPDEDPTDSETKVPGYMSQTFQGWDPNVYVEPYNGQPRGFACGGHKHAMGGMFDNGAMVGQAINMVGAGIGVALNAAGMAAQRNKAEEEAAKYNMDLQFLRDREVHDLESAVHDSKNNMFNMQAIQMKAHGGDLSTHGADFPMLGGYNFIGAGGSHEQNPYQGVPQGIAADGQENLVEQDEVVWNDYVFSRRLHVPGVIRSKYKLRDNMSFAEAAEKLTAEAKERPNDPISQNGLEAKLGELRDSQEDVRMRKQANQIKKQIASMSPEEIMQLQQLMQQEQGQQPGMFDAMGNVAQQPQFACGGRKFDDGGPRNVTRGYRTPDGKLWGVTQEEMDAIERGDIVVSYENGKLSMKRKKPGTTTKRSGSGVTPGERRVITEQGDEHLTGKYENTGSFHDESDAQYINSSRKDKRKTTKEVKDYENTPLYLKTNELIRSAVTKSLAGQELTADEQRAIDHYKEIDKQFTEGRKDPTKNLGVDDPKRLFDKNGNLKSNALEIIFGANGTGGLRTDQQWGPNHWVAEWLQEPTKREEYEEIPWSWEEITTDEDEEEKTLTQKKPQHLPDLGRYAPLLGPLFADYTARDYSTSIAPSPATYRPIGDYLPYNPVDSQRYLTALNQQDAARRGAISNMSGANRNMAMAQDALAEYQRQQDMANVLQNAEQINFDRRSKVGDFNRGTNQFNAQAYNTAELANMRLPEFMLHQAANNARMRKAVDDAIDDARSSNITNFLDNMGAIGRENMAFNMANENPALYYGMDPYGGINYKMTPAEAAAKETAKSGAAFGGMLTKRNKRRR